MKFIVNTTTLLEHLQSVHGTVQAKPILPILDNFLFDIKDGILNITTTDLETTMSTRFAVESDNDIQIAVPSKLTLETLRMLPSQPVTFSIDPQSNQIDIKSEQGRYKLNGFNATDFPKSPESEDTHGFTVPSDILLNCVAKTIFATGNDELRLNLTGVFVEMSDDSISFVSTDANRLVKCLRKDVKPGIESNFILPKKALLLLNKTLHNDSSPVQINFNDTNAFFKFGDIELICRLIDEKYPDYKAVIPDQNPNTLIADRVDFLSSVKRISNFANKSTNQIRLKIAGSEMHISAEDVDLAVEGVERMNCDYDGEDMEIGFNARFLTELLSNMYCKNVKFELSAPSRAGILVPDENDEGEVLMMLIMPMMLSNV
jgi:DNA polymerase-3 subunit beta